MGFSYFASFAMGLNGFIYAASNGVGAAGIVYRSTDDGSSWMPVGRLSSFVHSLVPSPEGTLFAGTSEGIFVSLDNGVEWSLTCAAPSGTVITSLAINSNGYAYVATLKDGLFKNQRRLGVGASAPTELPEEFALLQNYPNPFNPSTTFEFALPKSSFTTLVIYDVLGREVGKLVGGNLSAGKHAVPWTPREIASGTYFYRLQSGGYTATKRLVYLK